MNGFKVEGEKFNSTEPEVESESIDDSLIEKKNPFNLEWLFGFSPNVPLVNLTVDSSTKLFASVSGHVLQIFSCDGNKMQSFMGHENNIIVLDTNATGRFLLSADRSGVLNIWDVTIASEFPYPIRTIYETYEYNEELQQNLSKTALSCDGKCVITASDGRGSLIKFWHWSSNETDNPNDFFKLPEKFDDVVSVRFSCNVNNSTTFVVTSRNGVAFVQWDKNHQKLQRHFPARAISISFRYVDTVFVEKSHQAMSITTCGSVVVWSDVVTCSEEHDDEIMNLSFRKEFIKSVKLCENSLCVICSIDGYVMVCDVFGHIRFYDQQLKIVFWCPSNDSIDSVVTISFDLNQKPDKQCYEVDALTKPEKCLRVRDFFVQTRSDIFSVDVQRMEFNRTFYRSEDFITAIDIFPLDRNLICCGNYSGRVFVYDYERKIQLVEHQLKIQRRKSSTSDTEVVEIPHVSAIAISPDGHHLICGLDNGTLVTLDPNILHELETFNVSHQSITNMKFSADSTFVVIYDENFTLILLHLVNSIDNKTWRVLGKSRFHTKSICDVLYISPSTATNALSQHRHKLVPRLISLAQDRQIVEYDLMESMKESRVLTISFVKRIFQVALPVSMTLIHNSRLNDEQLLIADTNMKFKLFDKNTFEIMATFLGPIYDSYVKQFDANFMLAPTVRSKFFVFATSKNICLHAMPIDGNPFKSLAILGHCSGIKSIKADSTRQILFTIGHKCQTLFMWNINYRPLFDHAKEGGKGLKPFCDLLPGGKFGFFFQQMQSLFFYMLMLSNKNSIDDRLVKEGLESNEVADWMRGLGFFPSDYEIECLHHELQICGRRKVPFEDLVKLFVNHSNSSLNGMQENFESSLKALMDSTNSNNVMDTMNVSKLQLIAILAESAEKVDSKVAENYLREFFQKEDKITMQDFLQRVKGISYENCFGYDIVD